MPFYLPTFSMRYVAWAIFLLALLTWKAQANETNLDGLWGADRKARILQRSAEEDLRLMEQIRNSFVQVDAACAVTTLPTAGATDEEDALAPRPCLLEASSRRAFLDDLRRNYLEVCDDLEALIAKLPSARAHIFEDRRAGELVQGRLTVFSLGSSPREKVFLLGSDELKRRLPDVSQDDRLAAAIEAEADLKQNLFANGFQRFEERNFSSSLPSGNAFTADTVTEAKAVLSRISAKLARGRRAAVSLRRTPYFAALRSAYNSSARVFVNKVIQVQPTVDNLNATELSLNVEEL